MQSIWDWRLIWPLCMVLSMVSTNMSNLALVGVKIESPVKSIVHDNEINNKKYSFIPYFIFTKTMSTSDEQEQLLSSSTSTSTVTSTLSWLNNILLGVHGRLVVLLDQLESKNWELMSLEQIKRILQHSKELSTFWHKVNQRLEESLKYDTDSEQVHFLDLMGTITLLEEGRALLEQEFALEKEWQESMSS